MRVHPKNKLYDREIENICWSLYIFNIVNYFQASVSIRSRYSLYIDDCVSTTKHSSPIRRVMQRK